MFHLILGTGHSGQGCHGKLEPLRQPGRTPQWRRFRHRVIRRRDRFEPPGVDSGLQGGRRNISTDVDLGERHLFDGAPLPVPELGLERHRRLAVEPEPVTVPELVPGMDGHDLCVPLDHAFGVQQRDLVGARQILRVAGQGRNQRADVPAVLEQDDLLVGKDAVDFVLVANDLPADAIHGYDAFADPAVVVAVDDLQSLDLVTQQVHERTPVAQLFYRACHAVEPLLCVLSRRLERGAPHDRPGQRTQ